MDKYKKKKGKKKGREGERKGGEGGREGRCVIIKSHYIEVIGLPFFLTCCAIIIIKSYYNLISKHIANYWLSQVACLKSVFVFKLVTQFECIIDNCK